jgi:hypothetical protein
MDVNHRGLVNDQQVDAKRIVLVADKAPLFGAEFEQPVIVSAGRPVALPSACRASCRGGQHNLQALLFEDREEALDDGRLARSGPPVTTNALAVAAARTASRWSSESRIFWVRSIHSMAFSAWIETSPRGVRNRRFSSWSPAMLGGPK